MLIFKNSVFKIICSVVLLISGVTFGQEIPSTLNYLALGDSYTAGTSVCIMCAYPIQLQKKIKETDSINLKLTRIAKAGWRTDELIDALQKEKSVSNFDVVTLLIGVNNIYQKKSFSQFKKEFKELLQLSISKSNNRNVIVLSIPDYAYTPFGKREGNLKKISSTTDKYNAYAKKTAEEFEVTFLNITDITREGLKDRLLVASDGLHPSNKAYQQVAERLLPFVSDLLKK